MCSDFPDSYFDSLVRRYARIFLCYNWKQKNYCRDNDVVFFFFDTYPDLQDNISRGSAEGTANQGNVLQSNVSKAIILSPAVGGTTL